MSNLRKTARTVATALGSVLAVTMLAGTASATGESGATSGHDSQRAFVDVSVATVWSSPSSPRPIDRAAVENPSHVRAWISNMTVAEKRNLTADSRVQTQALYGTEVDVLKRKHGWAKVAVHGQPSPKNNHGYPGWVPVRQISRDPAFAAQRATEPFALVTAKSTRLHKPGASKRGSEIILSANTRLPVIARAHHGVLVATPGGKPGWIKARSVHVYRSRSEIPTPNRADLVQSAKRFLGKPYLWGGRSAFGFDCSGFTATVYQLHGITIPRDAGAQAHADVGTRVGKSSLEPGDLLFYAGDSGNIYHVAMYIGKGRMIEAYDAAHPVRITHVRFGEDYWGAVRYLQQS